MAETGRVLEDPDAVFGQSVVIRARHAVDDLLVRDSGRDDPDIYAAPCRQRKGVAHLIRDDQIRGDEPRVFLRALRHADVDVFPDMDLIHRRIRIRLCKAQMPACHSRCILQIFLLRLYSLFHLSEVFFRVLSDLGSLFLADLHFFLHYSLFCVSGQKILLEFFVILIICVDRVPHLQECHRKALNGVSFKAYAGILPEAIRLCSVEVLFRQVIAAGKTDFAVDHSDLAMVAVIQEHVEAGGKRIEHAALDPVAFRALYEIRIYEP